MKQYAMALSLLLSGQTALFGCATCLSLAEKSPKMPKNEVYVQLKKKNPSSKTRRRARKKCKKCAGNKKSSSDQKGA